VASKGAERHLVGGREGGRLENGTETATPARSHTSPWFPCHNGGEEEFFRSLEVAELFKY